MLVKRLLELAVLIQADHKRVDFAGDLGDLITLIDRQISSPSEGNLKSLREGLAKIVASLRESPLNKLSARDLEDLDEIRMLQDTGGRLADRLERIVTGGDLTLATAKAELQAVSEIMKEDATHIAGLVSALQYIGVEPDEVAPGDFELGVMIPRRAIDNEVRELGQELIRLDRILLVFDELVTGTRQSFRLKAISTTDPLVIMLAVPSVALAVATVIDKIMDIYTKVLGIRKMRNELHGAGLSEEALKGVTAHIEKIVADGLEQQAKDLEKLYLKSVEQSRKNELKQEIRLSIMEIAARIDEGYGFDVKGTNPEQDGEVSQEQQSLSLIADQVREIRGKLRLFAPADEPVLRLTRRRDG